MNDETNFKSNPLNGVSLKNLLIEVVDHYGFEILFAYLNINCFKNNPSIESSVKFLKNTEWARKKIEVFYLYEFKNLPKASSDQFSVPPRDRVIPEDKMPGEPAELSLEDAEWLREKRDKKFTERSQSHQPNQSPQQDGDSSSQDNNSSPSDSVKGVVDPWAKWRK